jgi:hypothetical protein
MSPGDHNITGNIGDNNTDLVTVQIDISQQNTVVISKGEEDPHMDPEKYV